MQRDLILGTAGHIDHGKTSLVRALTGIDCDRFPEEKARGITIDIGFAHLELDGVRLGIVDVPGHERFVKNMLAGATGMDLAILIVAADDSVMPQTREHLDILRLLGLRHGVIALTKADLVDEVTREVVELEIRDLVQGTFLESAPIIPTSATTGVGIAELKAAIRTECQKISATEATTAFRLAIDRSFTVQGHGTVVTGSVTSGELRVGDELDWHTGNGAIERIRVRALNNHGQSVESVHRGQRAAVNLAGVPHDQVQRGQELCSTGMLVPSKVLTVRLHALTAGRRPIKHRLPVRLHIGTAETMATTSVLDFDLVEPGKWAIAQLFLEEPVTAVWGQPFVLRDSSAEHTLGGGQILQPTAVKLRRRHLESLARVEQLGSDDPVQRATMAGWFAGFHGFAPTDLVRSAGLNPIQAAAINAELVAAGVFVEVPLPPNRMLQLHAERITELEQRILDVLAILHEQNPLMTNHDRQKTLARLDYVGDAALLQAVSDRMVKAKKLTGDARRIARTDFKPKLSINQRKLKDKIVEAHREAGFQPPEVKDFANQAAGNATALKDIFEVATAEGFLVKVSDDVYLHTESESVMRQRVTERLSKGPGATVAEIRDLLGTTRKYAVPICEYLDRSGLTRRDGDVRILASGG